MAFLGFATSPAEIPSNSIPSYEPTIIDIEKKNPFTPPVKKPPCDHRLLNPVGFPPFPTPKKITMNPKIIIKIIVTTLIIANQNSREAYALALAKFANTKNKIIIIPDQNTFTFGHQNFKYSVAATTSDIPTTIYSNTLAHSAKYPANGWTYSVA